MMTYLAIALGGGVGALARYGLMTWVSTQTDSRLPWGTLLVNVSGALLIGVLYVLVSEKMLLSNEARALLVVGFLGAFTTFSTFSLDTMLLIQQGWLIQAVGYMLASVMICVLATWLGMALARVLA
ncbi:MAG: fluoride efflux transporter CrcB [Pseudohongiella sp.]|uniref:fluoride efflux transporter CrcB n=1 Tax=Pseudohongiella sp. TaxID=1979412 RepID=UPI0034A08D40